MIAPSASLVATVKSVSTYCLARHNYKIAIAAPPSEHDKARALIRSLTNALPVRPATYILSMPTSESLKALFSLKESAIALVAHDFPDRLLRYARVHRYDTRERISILSVRLAPDKAQEPELMLYQDGLEGKPCLSASPFEPSAPAMQILHQDFFSASRHNGASL